jgi:hypothetical protein
MLKKCPGIDKLRADTRDKLKTYLQEQVIHKNFVPREEINLYLVIKSSFK